jgi:arabinose-5-phosphate isomerase
LRTHAPEKWSTLTAADIMTKDPLTIESSVLAIDAMKRMERNNKKAVSVLPVVGDDGKGV